MTGKSVSDSVCFYLHEIGRSKFVNIDSNTLNMAKVLLTLKAAALLAILKINTVCPQFYLLYMAILVDRIGGGIMLKKLFRN